MLELYRRGIISSGKAGDLLGMQRFDFVRYAGDLGIPFFRMNKDEWEAEKAVMDAWLKSEALSLPEDARIDVAAALLENVDHGPPDEGADEAWSAEAKRRLQEVRSGAVERVPCEEAERQIFDPSDDPNDR